MVADSKISGNVMTSNVVTAVHRANEMYRPSMSPIQTIDGTIDGI